VTHYYLKSLVSSPELIDNLLESNKNFHLFNVNNRPILMPEFGASAFRMGHSQVLELYTIPDNEGKGRFLFDDKRPDLRGFTDRFKKRDGLKMDWHLFLNFGLQEDRAQDSSAIDTKLTSPLGRIPFYEPGRRNLAEVDIQRNQHIPSGIDYAKFLADMIAPKEDIVLHKKEIQKIEGFESIHDLQDIPLWLYILLEAEIKYEGQKLGALGSQLIAEQIIWILKSDRSSFLNNEFDLEPAFSMWQEFAGVVHPGAIRLPLNTDVGFGLQDIIKFPDFVHQIINKIHANV
jgi:Animal haem peroxidase